MIKQMLILLLVFNLSFPATLIAQETEPPKIVEIEEGEASPFDGVLLNPTAAAQMLANQKFAEPNCKLKIDYELAKQKAACYLLLGNLNAGLEATDKKYNSIIEIKDAEIERLNEIALESANDYSAFWAAGGFVLGVAVSVGIFYAAVEVTNN